MASEQASRIRYPVRFKNIRSPGSRVRERSFQTVRETRSLKYFERARFLYGFSSLWGGMSSKRMEDRFHSWFSYSSIWRIGPVCSDAEGVATGIPLGLVVNLVCSSCFSSKLCACL